MTISKEERTKYTPGPIRVEEASTNSGKWLVLRVDDPAFDGGERDLCDTETIAVNVARIGATPNWKDKDDADEIRANAALWAAAPEMAEALLKAKETIHALHGDVAWEIYDRCSPEMKQINAALQKAGLLP